MNEELEELEMVDDGITRVSFNSLYIKWELEAHSPNPYVRPTKFVLRKRIARDSRRGDDKEYVLVLTRTEAVVIGDFLNSYA